MAVNQKEILGLEEGTKQKQRGVINSLRHCQDSGEAIDRQKGRISGSQPQEALPTTHQTRRLQPQLTPSPRAQLVAAIAKFGMQLGRMNNCKIIHVSEFGDESEDENERTLWFNPSLPIMLAPCLLTFPVIRVLGIRGDGNPIG